MRFVGEVKYGKYVDNFEEVHPDILDQYGNQGKPIISIHPTTDYSSKIILTL
jgi:hypothetical protein